jgi:hypothetical protein
MDSATAMKQGGVFRLLYPTTAMQFSDTVYIMREMPGGDPNGCPKIVTGRSPEPLAERGPFLDSPRAEVSLRPGHQRDASERKAISPEFG